MSESFMCLALVKPRSELARSWKLEKPGYCIYEYTTWARGQARDPLGRWLLAAAR